MDQLVEAYPQDLQVVYKHFPLNFHKNAMPAAKASVAAGKQGKFWEMHDKIMENYNALSEEYYIESAGEIGLDVEQFKADMTDPSTQAMVEEDMKLAGRSGVRGTPTIFFNGKKATGQRSFEAYKGIIDGLLKEKGKS